MKSMANPTSVQIRAALLEIMQKPHSGLIWSAMGFNRLHVAGLPFFDSTRDKNYRRVLTSLNVLHELGIVGKVTLTRNENVYWLYARDIRHAKEKDGLPL